MLHSNFRIVKKQMPKAWKMQCDFQGVLQTVPSAFVPIYVVQVRGTLWWHDVKAFNNIRDAVAFRNILNEERHGEI